MGDYFASGKRALGECDVCGFTYRLKRLKDVTVKGQNTNIKACPECWDKDHPQLKLGQRPIYDPQALRDPRPDFAGYAESRAQRVLLKPVAAAGFVRSLIASGT